MLQTAPPGATGGNAGFAVGRAPRFGLAVLLLAGAALMLWGSGPLRRAELVVTGFVIRVVTGPTVLYQPAHIVFFDTSASRPVGLQMTASCTAVFLIVPFVILSAGLILIRRVRAVRLLLGMVVGAIVVFSLNQVRLLIVAWATHRWGIGQGFDWSHILAGSFVTTLGMLLALYLFLRLALTERRIRL